MCILEGVAERHLGGHVSGVSDTAAIPGDAELVEREGSACSAARSRGCASAVRAPCARTGLHEKESECQRLCDGCVGFDIT